MKNVHTMFIRDDQEVMVMKRNWLDVTALILIIIGGINWGLVGFFNFNLITYFLAQHQ